VTIYRQVVGTTNPDGLLTERQVADESGLAVELVSSLIPRASAGAEVYDETGLWRARVAKMLLDNGIRMNLVKLAVREPVPVAELRAVVESLNAWSGPSA
jgi:hypothetical protein